MVRGKNSLIGLVIAAALFATSVLAPTYANAAFYEGKTLIIMIGLRPGGTVDTFARTFAPYWSKHTPGKPTIIIKNMPGAGGMRATNYVYEKAKPDGKTVFWGPWSPVGQALGRRELRARYENFEVLGGSGDTRLAYMRTDVPPGIKKPSDIVKAKRFRAGGGNPMGAVDLLSRTSLDLLGVKYDFVTGYRGGSAIYAAMLRNEVQYTQTSIGTFRTRSRDFIKRGEGMGLYYLVPVDADGSYKRNPNITEMPAFPDLFKEIYGKMPSGPVWDALNWYVNLVGRMTYIGFAPPGTPAEVVNDLRKGYWGAARDPGFIKQTMKRNKISYGTVEFKQALKIMKTLPNVDPKIIATFKKYVELGTR